MSNSKTVELQVGDVVDERYSISGRLGQGGMGTVYEVQQVKLQRSVALKVLRPEFAEKEKAAKRFEREAKAASSIDHRNVVKILDFGHLPSGELYYTMELLQGHDLSQLLRETGAIPWSRAGWIIVQVVRAFAAIHSQGIVHRDIKPANCFLLTPKPGDEPDSIKILDFGIANLQEDRDKATALTGAADIIGSVQYMAPEQITAEEIDARTDIYSLGVMMYELLTGQVPFQDASVYKVMLAHQQESPRPPSELVPDLPPEAEEIVLRAMAKSPDERFQSMDEIEAALAPIVEVPGTLAGGTTPRLAAGSAAFQWKTPRRGPRWWLIGAASLAFFIVAIAVTRWIRAPKSTEALAQQDDPEGERGAREANTEPDSEEGEEVSSTILPPPEMQYDPFADPFGAPPIRGQMARRPSPEAQGEGETDGIPDEEVPLEDLLPPESWTLDRGMIKGEVRNDRGGPLKNARVCAWIVDPQAPAELRRRPKCDRVDKRGRFTLSEIPPSFYDVHVFAEKKFLPQSYIEREGYPLTVLPGETFEGLEFQLEPGGAEITGSVKNKIGDPIPGAKVAVLGPARALGVADGSGKFTIWGTEGDTSLVAWAEGYTDVVASGDVSEPFSMVLRRESRLLGRVIDTKTEEPVAGARVRAGRQGAGVNPLVYTNAAGEFTMTGLAEGSYLPSARTDDFYGEASKIIKLKEAVMPPELVIRALRIRVETPVAPVPVPEPEPEGSTGSIEGTGTGTGTSGGTDSSGGTGAEATDGTGDADELIIDDEGDEIVLDDPASPPTEPSEPDKPKVTDRSLRRAFGKKLQSCGNSGAIEITAKFVLDTGKLFQGKLKLTGEAKTDPKVGACAEKQLKKFQLMRRKEPSDFKPLVVTLTP